MAIKRRKPAAVRKTLFLRVRITKAHAQEFRRAARAAGISVAAWAIERLHQIAQHELRQQATAAKAHKRRLDGDGDDGDPFS